MRNRSVTYSSRPARATSPSHQSRAQWGPRHGADLVLRTDAAFHALADPTRRAVLDLLRRGALPAGQIAETFPVSRPAISKHLRQLRKARLVVEQRRGRHRFYQLNAEPLKAVASWLDDYRRFWESSLANLKAFVESEYVRETERIPSKTK